jgi:hypothetical protein
LDLINSELLRATASPKVLLGAIILNLSPVIVWAMSEMFVFPMTLKHLFTLLFMEQIR